MIYITESPEETYTLGIKIGKDLNPGDIISLNGDLGAGKTQLVKGIAKGLGVEDYITSPTFTIINEYEGRLPLYHFDVYRIEDTQELYEIGFDEYIYGEGVSIIEWGDMVKDMIPANATRIFIKKIDDNTRRVIIEDGSKEYDSEEQEI